MTEHVKSSRNVEIFKKKLITHLFTEAYDIENMCIKNDFIKYSIPRSKWLLGWTLVGNSPFTALPRFPILQSIACVIYTKGMPNKKNTYAYTLNLRTLLYESAVNVSYIMYSYTN